MVRFLRRAWAVALEAGHKKATHVRRCGEWAYGWALLAATPSHFLECLGHNGQQFSTACLGQQGARGCLHCPSVLPGLTGGGPDNDGGPGSADVRLYPF